MESVSALMDGELDSDEAAREIARFKQDAVRHDAWSAYHVIGDALRGEPASAELTPEFSRRLHERLALEPTVMAPRLRLPQTIKDHALAIAASVAAFGAVGWMAANMLNQDAATLTLAQAPAGKSAVVAPQQPAVPAFPPLAAAAPEHVHEYMLAHQGISPSTAIQGVTPYIRTVSSADNELRLR